MRETLRMGTNLDAPCVELHVGVVGHKRVLHQLCQHMPPCTHHAKQGNALTLGGPKPYLGFRCQGPCRNGIALLEPHFSQAFRIKTCCQGTHADD